MAAVLRSAEGGYIFSKSSGGVFSTFFRPGGVYPPTPSYSRPLVIPPREKIRSYAPSRLGPWASLKEFICIFGSQI